MSANQRQMESNINIKVDFSAENINRDKEYHSISINGSIHFEDAILNIYAPNNRNLKYMNQN